MLATAILASLASLLLGQLNYHQRQLSDLDNQAQALSVAIMAVQTHQQHLQKNGQDITISQFGTETVIKSKGKDIFRVKKLSP
ncbi:competence type IV pilus minor pilin ComGE [Streptococcus jiangjianxini]|uniref:competence type IV pilus minor pilin ComGE n=1 Tax=Streptococcus jiangjianxini TaxID=3161189 RepID=UPI0032ECAF0D